MTEGRKSQESCRHEQLIRLDDCGAMTIGVYRCPDCKGLVLVPAQYTPGIRKILEKAAAMENA